jgi:VanZ family protein
MPKHIENWLLGKALYIALFVSVAIAFLSLINTNQLSNPSIGVSDKVLHISAYIVLFWSWMLVFKKDSSFRTRLILFMSLFFFGIVLEWMQGELTSYRTADWKDIVANSVGLFLGFFTFNKLYQLVFK